ncbi:MAG: hypothetical protein OEV23_06200 [Gallionella sp.]|nr:hypothetical protein [Gallionella sp.]
MTQNTQHVPGNSKTLDLGEYHEAGLYLVFPDASRLTLTPSVIAQVSRAYWADPSKITPQTKASAEFQLCEHCPVRKLPAGNDGSHMCHAMQPLLPFIDKVDQYMSFDRVLAIYKADDQDVLYVSETTMQIALQYIAIVCLTQYCEYGGLYLKYFKDVVPIMEVDKIASRIYLNIYWLHDGDLDRIKKAIDTFTRYIAISSECLVHRMNMICKNDAFAHAFANTHVVTQFFAMNMEQVLSSYFEEGTRARTCL